MLVEGQNRIKELEKEVNILKQANEGMVYNLYYDVIKQSAITIERSPHLKQYKLVSTRSFLVLLILVTKLKILTCV